MTDSYVILKTGGQQFMVKPGDKIKVNKITGAKGDSVTFDEVLCSSENGSTEFGTPTLKTKKVTAKILAQLKAAKVVAYKKKRRKGFEWKKGHRQQLTEVLIEAI